MSEEASSGRKRKLYQVAKELNLAHTTLQDFLNSQGFDMPKKHMSIVTPEMYEEVVKKFDQNRWRKSQEQEEIVREGSKTQDAVLLREQELDRILQSITDQPSKTEKETVLNDMETPVSENALGGEDTQESKTVIDRAEEYLKSKSADMDAESQEDVIAEALRMAKIDQKELESRKTKKKSQKEKKKMQQEDQAEYEPEIEETAIDDGLSVDEYIEKVVEIIETHEEIREMQPLGDVVAEALKLANRIPKVVKKVKEEHISPKTAGKGEKKTAADGEEAKKKAKRKKKPRRPEKPSEAAIGLEREKRAKKGKKVVPGAPQPASETETEEPKRKRRRGKKKKKIDAKEVAASIKETLAKIEDKGKGRRKKKKMIGTEEVEVDACELEVTEFISAQELANLMDINVTDVIKKAMEMGLLISINQRLDQDTITLLADEFDFTVIFVSSIEEVLVDEPEEEKAEEVPRAPVVTVMGHVDHGKTSLLDYIRRSNIIAGESGGITQHIGAYKLEYNDRHITFLDTPGHEAFTAMRARGAQVTDIVVLVVAADDQVMPQTVEAINHAQAANVPIIIAISKIDKPNALPDKVRQQLADQNILVEDWGGKYQCTEISAKFGQGIDKLMEEILLLADMMEFKSPAKCRARGVVIDSRLDKGRGAIATVLIQKGTLHVGDHFVADQFAGKVRAMLDERSKPVSEAGPSDPVQILGFEGTPQAGESFFVYPTEKEAKNISLRRQQLQREQSFRQIRMLTLEQISERIKHGEVQELPLIIKGDVHGSVEAIADSLMKLKTDEVGVTVIQKGVGAITEGDVLLASTTDAVIFGFHVHANKKARELAAHEHVEIKSYRIIYDIVDDVKKALEGLLRPKITEEIQGEIEVRDLFKISAIGTIAGCHVSEGKIVRNMKIKVYRGGVEIWDGELDSLKRFKDDVKEVLAGFDCGIKVKNFNDLKPGDIIQPYTILETKRALEM